MGFANGFGFLKLAGIGTLAFGNGTVGFGFAFVAGKSGSSVIFILPL